MIWTASDGERRQFTLLADGSYANDPGVFGTFASEDGGAYSYTDLSGTKHHFVQGKDINGNTISHLDYISDRNGNKLQLTYDSTGQFLQSVADVTVTTPSRWLKFTWVGNHISQVADFTGRTWTYSYSTITGGALTGTALSEVDSPTDSLTTQLKVLYSYSANPQLFGLLTCITALTATFTPRC